MNYADVFVEVRAKTKWSQEELGERLGISQKTVSTIERGAHNVSKTVRCRLDKVLAEQGMPPIDDPADAPAHGKPEQPLCNISKFGRKLMRLCDEKGVDRATFFKGIKASSDVIPRWYLRGELPNEKYLNRISGYFGISVDDLKTDDPPATAWDMATVINRCGKQYMDIMSNIGKALTYDQNPELHEAIKTVGALSVKLRRGLADLLNAAAPTMKKIAGLGQIPVLPHLAKRGAFTGDSTNKNSAVAGDHVDVAHNDMGSLVEIIRQQSAAIDRLSQTIERQSETIRDLQKGGGADVAGIDLSKAGIG